VTLCLVTDRRRLVPEGAPNGTAVECLLEQVRHACAAGVDLVQVRERDLEAGALAALVRAVVDAARGTPTRIVVNDRADVAIACGAHGVHLRGDGMTAAALRGLTPKGFLVGRSVHGVDDLPAADGADYLIAGTVFETASKPGLQARLGIDGLRAVARAAHAPVLAIGGVTTDRMPEVAAAGASGAAAIGLFVQRGGGSAGCGACALKDVVSHVRAAFDSAISRP